MSNILGTYNNGNYTVTIYSDGTKIRENKLSRLIPSFAESVDLKITDKCNGGCEFCYEGCTVSGKHADLLSYSFLNNLHPYTELAINGNDMTHPQLAKFLVKMKKQKIIVNMTVNQKHFLENYDTLRKLSDRKLIYGIGVSLTDPNPEFIEKFNSIPNTVLHVIAGIFSPIDIEKLQNKNVKLLILGYKNKGRGIDYWNTHSTQVQTNINYLKESVSSILNKFSVVSFDNLAIEQLNIRSLFKRQKDWEEFYMGDDADFTFYIDAVNGTFAKNSITTNHYPIEDKTIDEMFELIRNK